MSDLAPYLTRLGYAEPPPPTLDSLVALHRAHLVRVPYENLGIMLGRPPSVEPEASLARVGRVGRAGYCFHQNGALETALRALGYRVTRRHGHVWFDESHRYADQLNHLVLLVSGLPGEGHPGGTWWVDAGLGEGFLDPLPVVPGDHPQDGFGYRIDGVSDAGWSFRPEQPVSFTGIEVTTRPVDRSAVAAAHRVLSTPPDGKFTRVLVVQRRIAGYIDSLRCCLLTRIGPGGKDETELTTYDAWRAAITDALGLPVDDVPDEALRDLFRRMRQAHENWDAAGRP